MQINREALTKIHGISGDNQDVRVSLWVVSKKDSRLKQLNLGPHLTVEQRAAKLQKLAQENRFVAVIQIGEAIFAHAHSHFAKQLEAQGDLSINGKRVSVQSLTDEQAEELAAVGEAFDEYALEEEETTVEKEKEELSNELPYSLRSLAERIQVITGHANPSPEMMAKMRISEIVLDSLKQFSEARREEQKLREADEKYYNIKAQQIKKAVFAEAIVQEAVKSQLRNQQMIVDDTEFHQK